MITVPVKNIAKSFGVAAARAQTPREARVTATKSQIPKVELDDVFHVLDDFTAACDWILELLLISAYQHFQYANEPLALGDNDL